MTESNLSGAGQSRSKDRLAHSAIADVLTLLHGEADARPAAAYAVELAVAFGAHLTIAGLARDPSRQFYLAQAPAEALSAAVNAAHAEAEAFATEVAAAAVDRGLDSTSMTLDIQIGHGSGEVVQLIRLFDIAVLARPAGEDAARDETLLEAMLLQSGRALIVVPPAYDGPVSFARPIVAWDGSRSAARALAEAMPILRHNGEAQVVTVAGQHGSAPAIPDIAPHIERHGIACTHYEPALSQSVAQTLLAHTHRASSDLLVMGAFGHSRLRGRVLGGTTRDILLAASLPVLLAY